MRPSGRSRALSRCSRDWRRRIRSRAELLRFSDRQLRDIGVTRADVAREHAKPFWRD